MSGSITTIEGRRCTQRPKAQTLDTGRGAISTISSISSQATSTTSTPSSTSISTTFSTSSISISTPIVTSTSLFSSPIVNAPAPDTFTSATQEILTSTTSSTSSQSVIPITTSSPITTQTSSSILPPISVSIPQQVAPIFQPEQPFTSSITSSIPIAPTTSTISSSTPTTDQQLGSATQTNLSLAPTATAAVSLDISSSASEIVVADTTTATTAPAITTATSGQPFGAGRTNGVQNATGNAISTQTTVTIAGGVIGGLALISIIAFLLWFWRKRIMKKRRSTLLTPLSTGVVYGGGGGGGGEKGSYVISRNSLGPTTIPEKVRAMVGYNYHRLRGRVNSLVARSPKPSVDLNRGNSQFGLPGRSEMRSASGAGIASNEAATAKNRLVGWWGRLIEDSNLNWKRRGDPKSERSNNDKYTSMPKATQPRDKVTQPDFLTLLSMDEQQQQQQQQQQRGGGSNPRRSQSLGNDHFLGGLGLNFDTENPFADSNAMSHNSAKVQPLTVSGALASDPFSDANAIPAPARFTNGSSGAGGPVTYVQNIRRSRGHSVSAANARPPSGGGGGGVAVGSRMPGLYRESSVSIETSDTRRNKFRSDPFDLDRPELLAQSPPPGPGGGGYVNPRGLPSMPRPARARTESLTSKYSSGVSSMAEWSDPGPDVGPAAGRWDTPSPDGALGRRQPLNSTSVDRGKGGGSQRSVGKAM